MCVLRIRTEPCSLDVTTEKKKTEQQNGEGKAKKNVIFLFFACVCVWLGCLLLQFPSSKKEKRKKRGKSERFAAGVWCRTQEVKKAHGGCRGTECACNSLSCPVCGRYEQ